MKLHTLGIMIACLLAPLLAQAGMLTVQSTTDSNGMYFYRVSRGTDPVVWGGGGGTLSLTIYSWGVLNTYDPPGWTSVTVTPDVVVWTYADTVPWLVGTESATLSLRSTSPTPVLYDGTASNAVYQQGVLVGQVYSTNGALYQDIPSNATASVNIVGYERFSLIGPSVPEPGLLAGAVAVLILRARRRVTSA